MSSTHEVRVEAVDAVRSPVTGFTLAASAQLRDGTISVLPIAGASVRVPSDALWFVLYVDHPSHVRFTALLLPAPTSHAIGLGRFVLGGSEVATIRAAANATVVTCALSRMIDIEESDTLAGPPFAPDLRSKPNINMFPTAPFLGPDGAQGWARLNRKTLPIPDPHGGRVYGMAHIAEPRIVLAYRSGAMALDAEDSKPDPLSFHLHLHPDQAVIHDRVPYPAGKVRGQLHYKGIAVAYLQTFTRGMSHHHWAGKPVVFVVPAKGARGRFPGASDPSDVMRLFAEVNLFMHAKDGLGWGAWQRHPIGKVAVSAFSTGVGYALEAAFASSGAAIFWKNHLRELYVFDGGSVSQLMDKRVFNWVRAKPGKRHIRIYSRNRAMKATSSLVAPTFSSITRSYEGENKTGAPVDVTATEIHGKYGSVLIVPPEFWWVKGDGQYLHRYYDPRSHAAMVVAFMYHAISESGF